MLNQIESKRLMLRKPEKDDLKSLFDIHSDPNTNHYNPSGPHLNVDQTEEMLTGWLRHWDENGFGYWTVITKENDEIIGACGIKKEQIKGKQVYNVYYRTKPSSWKKGYIKEAALLSIHYLQNYVDSDAAIMIRTKADNLPSIKTALSLGFKHQKLLDDFNERGDVYYFNKNINFLT